MSGARPPRATLLMALAGAMALVAVSAPLAAASGMFDVATGAPLPGTFSADQAAVPGARRLLQSCSTCANQGKSPVCGADKKTYDNICYANCAKAKIAYIGKCVKSPCVCSFEFKPVCGGGKSYFSACFAKCAGVSSTKSGACSATCAGASKPVCGLDGRDYGDSCKAYSAGTQPYYSGSCDKRISTCACSLASDPVCVKTAIVTEIPGVGTTRTPYTITAVNPCLAKCQNDPSATWTKGACEGSYPYDVSQYLCGCGLDIKPVCAQFPGVARNLTVLNACTAKCSGFKVLYDGTCKDECLCPAYSTGDVCANGTPYKSACQARCAGEKTWTAGRCAKCKSCPGFTSLDNYVCGTDGIPYVSACTAECAGVKIAYKGMCKMTGRK